MLGRGAPIGKQFPLGGMNERGLVIEEMSYSPSKYPAQELKKVNESQWIQYQLDNSQSVKEVIKSLKHISISPFLFKLHYIVCDSSGRIALIEFIDGKVKIYTDDDIVAPVLTNYNYKNNSQKFDKYTLDKNSELLEIIFRKLIEADELSEITGTKYLKDLIHYSKNYSH